MIEDLNEPSSWKRPEAPLKCGIGIVNLLKKKIADSYGEKLDSKRPWLFSAPRDSYDNTNYRVELYVFAGSPPKGYILIDYANGLARAFGCDGRPLATRRFNRNNDGEILSAV